MATIRSFDKPFEMVDYTEDLVIIPNTWGLVNQMGIFRNESISQHSINIEKTDGTLAVIGDKVRGAKNLVNKDDTRQILSFAVPHFPLDDAVSPEDVQGKRAYGSPDAAETEAAVIARKLNRIRKNHAVTMEAARCFAITDGQIYAPNGTVIGNYYTSFGVTRKVIDFELDVGLTNVIAKGEEAIAHIEDNILSGESISSVVALCSPEYFAALIGHATIAEAYKYYSSTQDPLRNRMVSGVNRTFVFGGITYIEYRGSYNGTRLIPAGDVYFMPMGTEDMFISYFSPANKFSHVNSLGEEAYAFVYRDQKDSAIDIETEHNAIHLIRRPQAVVRGYMY